MRISKKVRFGAAAMVIVAGGAVAALGSASPAVAFFSPPLFLDVSVDSPATLVAGGAAVDVPVVVTCTSDVADLFVLVTEQTGGKTVSQGSEDATVGCTDSHERVLVRVTPFIGSFRKGTAVAEADVNGCAPDFSVCGTESDSETIPITR